MDSAWSHEVAISKFGSLFNDYERLMNEKNKQISQLKEQIELLQIRINKLLHQSAEVIEEPDIPLTQ